MLKARLTRSCRILEASRGIKQDFGKSDCGVYDRFVFSSIHDVGISKMIYSFAELFILQFILNGRLNEKAGCLTDSLLFCIKVLMRK